MDARPRENRKRKERKNRSRPTHRAALVDKLRGFAAAASAGAAFIASLDSTRLRSAPFDSSPFDAPRRTASKRVRRRASTTPFANLAGKTFTGNACDRSRIQLIRIFVGSPSYPQESTNYHRRVLTCYYRPPDPP